MRVQAVAALRPFQFELEEDEDHDEVALGEDRVRAELMRAMKSDSSPDVREAALVAVTKAVGMFDQASRRNKLTAQVDITKQVRVPYSTEGSTPVNTGVAQKKAHAP